VDFERSAAPRHDGILNRLTSGRARTASASSSTGDGIDQVHSATPLPIGTRLGTFQVTSIIHRDLSGVVYAGEDRSSQRKVAIKEYLPATLADRMTSGKVGLRSLRYKPSFQEGKDRFLSNGRMLAALDEPALIRVLRCWKQNGTAYMAMPLYEGQTLHEVLKVSTPPGESWLKAMLGPLLDALTTLHRFDCYPCNVTPDNIVMLQEGTPLLFAFGAGRRTTANASGDLRHDLNPGFAPIEQYAHDPTMPEGPWTDVYAVAAVIRFAITGKPLPALAARMASDTLTPLRNAHTDYSAAFLDAVDRGVAVLPRDRPQTIAAFRKALGIPGLGSSGASTMLPDASPASANAARWTTKFSGDEIPEDAVPEGTRAAISSVDQIVLPPLSLPSESAARDGASQATMQSSPGGLPWKLIPQVFVVGLFAFGLLVWGVLERDQPAPATVDGAPTPPPIASGGAQPSGPPVASAPAPTLPVPAASGSTETIVPPVASPVIADSTPKARDERVAATAPSIQATPAESTPAAPRIGKVRLSIKPWGEVIVDGKSRGVSPPLKELSIPEGRHRIQIRNGEFPGYDSELAVKAGSKVEIAHSFKAP
jgi:serine/threonine protein kinase